MSALVWWFVGTGNWKWRDGRPAALVLLLLIVVFIAR